MADLMFPNIVDAYNQGAQAGRQLQFNQLAGQAYQAQPGQDRDALIAQMAGLDPGSADAVSKNLQNMQDIHDARIGAAANYVLQKWQQAKGNPDDPAVQGAYEAIKPVLNEYGSNLLNGQSAGDKFDPAALPHIYALASKYQYALNQKMPAAVQAMQYMAGQLGDAAPDYFRIKAGIDPRAVSPDYQQVKIPDGRGGTIQGFINKRTGQFETPDYSPVTGGIGQQGNASGGQLPQGSGGYGVQVDYATPINRLIDSGMSPDQAMWKAFSEAGSPANFRVTPDPANPGRFINAAVPPGVAGQIANGGAPNGSGGGLGYTPAKQPGTDAIAKRQQEIAALEQAGTNFTDAQRQNYLTTGKYEPDPNAPLSSEQETNAQKIANYQLDPRLIPAKDRETVLGRAAQLNPDFDATKYQAALNFRKGMASGTPGSDGAALTAARTGLAHLEQLADISNHLPGNWGIVNQATNAIAQFRNDPDVAPYLTQWNTAKNAVAAEVSKMLKGGVPAEGEIHDALQNLDPNNPNRLQAVATLAKLMSERVQEIDQKRSDILGGSYQGTSLLNSKDQQRAYRLVGLGKGLGQPEFGSPTDAPTASAGDAQQAANSSATPDFSHLWN